MKFSIENGFFIPSPSRAAEKQGAGLKSSSENDKFKLRMKFQARMVLSCVGEWSFHAFERDELFRSSGPLGKQNHNCQNIFTGMQI